MKERGKERQGFISKVLFVISGRPDIDDRREEEEQLEPKDSDPIDLRFVKRFTKAGGKFIYCAGVEELQQSLVEIAQELDCQNAFCASNQCLEILEDLDHPFTYSSAKDAEVFLTDCESLVAFNGGIMITARQKGGKKPDELPRNVVAIAYSDQLVDKLNDGLTLIRERYKDDIPTQITTIHGPKQSVQTDSTQTQWRNLFLLLTER